MNIVYKNVDELIPYANNTKKHDKTQIKNVATSIDKYGFVQPLVIDKNNVVVIGHCRLLGAKQLNMETVPCVCVDDLTEEQVNALRIVDNKSNESEWDMDILPDELLNVDLSAFSFDFGDIFGEDNIETKEREEIALNESISVVVECEDDEEAETIFERLSFGSVPSWLKPYAVLSNGEKMRVDLARALLEKDFIVFDEFTSVVDRQIAQTACIAINKALKKTNKKFIAVTCHYDILDWLQPDWVFDTNKMQCFFGNAHDRKNNLKLENAVSMSGQSLDVIII